MERLVLQLDLEPALAEFSSAKVNLEDSEANEASGLGSVFHDWIAPVVRRVYHSGNPDSIRSGFDEEKRDVGFVADLGAGGA
jgi:hypothetical protein